MYWVHALSCGNALSSLRSGNTFYGPLLDQDYICWYLVEQLQDFQVNLDTYCYYFLAIYLLVNRFNLLVQRLPTKANVRVELTASIEDDKPYNSTMVFLFD